MSERAREAAARAIHDRYEQITHWVKTLGKEPRPMETSGIREVHRLDANAAIDAFLAALKADGYVVHGPNARWIEIGDAGAVVQFREGADAVIHNADYGMYYETPESQPVTVFKPRAVAEALTEVKS